MRKFLAEPENVDLTVVEGHRLTQEEQQLLSEFIRQRKQAPPHRVSPDKKKEKKAR
ncbi:hypothetical protein SAMN05421823_12118 [Catalinimonas alkaloidigena]|uniref:Uncharacterized protein n=1 Tax=Catalinimonas alkaloidigena TaxID=1075417 RepID=A0A1G9VJZ1_9BACT|nr:hypothetical protein [Catalinimonas alkaloidigena]SDM72514.1 hypothetical protein SAMN05421823_12118 [Catalinimonas alkaloidigena]